MWIAGSIIAFSGFVLWIMKEVLARRVFSGYSPGFFQALVAACEGNWALSQARVVTNGS
jgi:hypothetical protein